MSAREEQARALARRAVVEMLNAPATQIETVLARVFEEAICDAFDACAAICDEHHGATGEKAGRDIADAIRARGAS